MTRWVSGKLKIVFVMLTVGLFLGLFGASAYAEFGDAGVTVLDLAISGVLSAALVILYFRQTTILKSQKDLLTQELNREARQQHTETLRERVRVWHGDLDNETVKDPTKQNKGNLPKVRGASFQPAPAEFSVFGGEEESFRVVPGELQGDRYLEDLLQNHAHDLQETKKEIEQLQSRFVSLREEFLEEYQDAIVVEKEEYVLQPDESLAQWVFELVVLLKRGYYEDFEHLQERAISKFEDGSTGLHPDKPWIWIRVDHSAGGERAIYSARAESCDQEELQVLRVDAKEDAKESVKRVIDNIDEDYPYDLAHKAADILDEAEQAVDELEHLLIEYDGRPIYTGDCKYLEEARV